jgi:DNA-binding Lrp family transcriptional regulator
VTAANPGGVDRLDAALLTLLASDPRTSVLEAARRLGVARGTVQARMDRLHRDGVLRGLGPDVDPAAVGYPVTAFSTLEIRQGGGRDVVDRLARVPEVLEAHTITGRGDMLVRLVARSTADLQRVIDLVVADEAVLRTSTVVAMAEVLPLRTLPLVHAAAGDPPAGPGLPVEGLGTERGRAGHEAGAPAAAGTEEEREP